MPLKIQGKKTNTETPQGPHAEAAAEMAATKENWSAHGTDKEGSTVSYEADSVAHAPAPLPHEKVSVLAGYNFPIQQYHMLKFEVYVERTYPAGDEEAREAAYEDCKAFTDAKLNELIAENQPEG